ncbi:hypothetical protein A2160_05110 [Candidatus Beckwithbacteria bacterium RBG_13_42_9]|uniref:Four helix bundle protein n=1 Tax=Candidatus Beckwithbacteria bacterium RBG_13_42_9 TaxID=1797457 RepID=A0A1F5E6W0_9BACT|nr:MAG: hypothetical protein A2160_05110 [Candidatus Beckwithbacteria bacterium RBG_13_42_9]
MLPKYKYLLTYRYSEMIHDLTVEFCQNFLINFDFRRTREQMIQAARSGKQNIVEGVGQSRTSKKGEIKLLGVAKASLEELLTDYEDFLRQRKLAIWPKSDSRITVFRKKAFFLSHLSNLSHLGSLKEKPILPQSMETAANFLLTLCHQATFLLDRQIKKAEEIFVNEGGYTENLFKKRLGVKIQRSNKLS